MQEQGGDLMGGEMGLNDVHRRIKAEIVTLPLYEQLVVAHVSCLQVATTIHQLPIIDAQLSQSHNLLHSYASQVST